MCELQILKNMFTSLSKAHYLIKYRRINLNIRLSKDLKNNTVPLCTYFLAWPNEANHFFSFFVPMFFFNLTNSERRQLLAILSNAGIKSIALLHNNMLTSSRTESIQVLLGFISHYLEAKSDNHIRQMCCCNVRKRGSTCSSHVTSQHPF